MGSSRSAPTPSAEYAEGTRGSSSRRSGVQPDGREGRDTHPVPGPVLRDAPGEGRHGRVGLCVDVDLDLGPGREQLVEERNRFSTTDACGRHVDVVHLGDDAGEIGRPVECGVVEREQFAVAGGVDVGLEVAVAECDSSLKRHQRVLQAKAVAGERAPSVSEGDRRSAVVEVGVVVRSSDPAHSLEV